MESAALMIELLVGKWRKAPPAHLHAAHRYYWQADVVQICFVFRMIVMKRVINIANITIDSVLFGFFFYLQYCFAMIHRSCMGYSLFSASKKLKYASLNLCLEIIKSC